MGARTRVTAMVRARRRGVAEAAGAKGTITQVTAEDVVEALTSSKSVIIVPGYGMAVAKAQHAIAEMTTFLRTRGIQVRFAIHPVAGRLPGYMNGKLSNCIQCIVLYCIEFVMIASYTDVHACIP